MSIPPPVHPRGLADAEQKALWGLVCGILNFVVCGFLCAPALIFSNQALRVLDRLGVQSRSRDYAVIGRILGYVGIALLIGGICLGALWVMLAVGLGAGGGMRVSPW